MAGWTEIETVTLESAAASIVFNVGGYQFYRVSGYWGAAGGVVAIRSQLNGDTGTNYARQRIRADATAVNGARATGQTLFETDDGIADGRFASFEMIVAKPAAGLKAQVLWPVGQQKSDGSNPLLSLIGGEWNNTSDALTSITFSAHALNFAIGTSIMVEGLAT